MCMVTRGHFITIKIFPEGSWGAIARRTAAPRSSSLRSQVICASTLKFVPRRPCLPLLFKQKRLQYKIAKIKSILQIYEGGALSRS